MLPQNNKYKKTENILALQVVFPNEIIYPLWRAVSGD
jgi:hypothetical protein